MLKSIVQLGVSIQNLIGEYVYMFDFEQFNGLNDFWVLFIIVELFVCVEKKYGFCKFNSV